MGVVDKVYFEAEEVQNLLTFIQEQFPESYTFLKVDVDPENGNIELIILVRWDDYDGKCELLYKALDTYRELTGKELPIFVHTDFVLEGLRRENTQKEV